ncbi:MAG: RNA polymerase sigma factor [Phycisphaerales bacterium]
MYGNCGEPDEPDDRALVERMNRDWPDAADDFRTLYERTKEPALRIALRFASDRDAAMDAVQEAFLALWGRFPGFVLTGRLLTFLYPVIRNQALAAARKRSRVRLTGDLAGGDGGAAAEGVGGLEESAFGGGGRGVRGAIEDLPEGQREVLLLRVVEEMSVGEVAEALQIPEGTVKSRLFKALGTLRADPRARAHFEDVMGSGAG